MPGLRHIPYKWNYWRVEFLVICLNNAIGSIFNCWISVLLKRNLCLLHKCPDNGLQLIWRSLQDSPNAKLKSLSIFLLIRYIRQIFYAHVITMYHVTSVISTGIFVYSCLLSSVHTVLEIPSHRSRYVHTYIADMYIVVILLQGMKLCILLYVTEYWKTDHVRTFGQLLFIGPANSHTHTLPVHCCINGLS